MPFCPWSQCLKLPFQLPCVCSLRSPHLSTLSYYHQADHHHSPPHLIDDPCSFVTEWRAFFTFTSSAIFLLVFICNSLLRSAGVEFRFQIKTVGNGKRDKDSYRKRQRETEREREMHSWAARLKEKFCTNDDGEMEVLKSEMNWTWTFKLLHKEEGEMNLGLEVQINKLRFHFVQGRRTSDKQQCGTFW